MNRVIVLDSHPLSLLANPKPSPAVSACQQWARDLNAGGDQIVIAEIVDYEVRRERVRSGKRKSIAALDALAGMYRYLPLTTAVMRLAADLWAHARIAGQPTAADARLDIDVILAGQAIALGNPGVIVATSNVGHLAHFVHASVWTNIAP